MQASLDKQALLQRCQALRVKAQGLLHAQIPAPSDHQEAFESFPNPACAVHKVREEQDIGVHVSQIWAVVQASAQREDGTNQRRPQRVHCHLRQVRESEFGGGFRDAGFVPDQRDSHIRAKRLPGCQRVALNERNVRVGKRLGGSKKRD